MLRLKAVTFDEVTGIDVTVDTDEITTALSAEAYEADRRRGTMDGDTPVTLGHRGADSSKFDIRSCEW